MSVKSNLNNRIDQAKAFADKLRKAYHDAYEKAVEATSEKVDDLRKVGEHLDGDAVRDAIATKIQAAHKMVDDLNRSLADKAVPAFRKRNNTPDDGEQAPSQVSETRKAGFSGENSTALPIKKPRAKKVSATRAPSATKRAAPKKAAVVPNNSAAPKRRASSKKLPPDTEASS